MINWPYATEHIYDCVTVNLELRTLDICKVSPATTGSGWSSQKWTSLAGCSWELLYVDISSYRHHITVGEFSGTSNDAIGSWLTMCLQWLCIRDGQQRDPQFDKPLPRWSVFNDKSGDEFVPAWYVGVPRCWAIWAMLTAYSIFNFDETSHVQTLKSLTADKYPYK